MYLFSELKRNQHKILEHDDVQRLQTRVADSRHRIGTLKEDVSLTLNKIIIKTTEVLVHPPTKNKSQEKMRRALQHAFNAFDSNKNGSLSLKVCAFFSLLVCVKIGSWNPNNGYSKYVASSALFG